MLTSQDWLCLETQMVSIKLTDFLLGFLFVVVFFFPGLLFCSQLQTNHVYYTIHQITDLTMSICVVDE